MLSQYNLSVKYENKAKTRTKFLPVKKRHPHKGVAFSYIWKFLRKKVYQPYTKQKIQSETYPKSKCFFPFPPKNKTSDYKKTILRQMSAGNINPSSDIDSNSQQDFTLF